MYQKYFKLEENPFSLTPDPRFLFLSKRHREGIAHLLYGMGEDGGFVLLTGEVGTGKTTLYRSVLEQAPENVDVALVLNPRQSAHELLATVCDELRVSYDKQATTIQTRVNALNRHLLNSHANGRRTVLIIDEAQNLEVGVLEQIRLLTNLETTKHKLLQIILVGQPELKDLLDRPDLRQLNQRITARYHLMPLNKIETAAYVRHRLLCAGLSRPLFNRDALKVVHRLSKGVPRLINIICERSLLAAYAQEYEQISAKLVRKAAKEAIGQKSVRGWKWSLAVSSSFLVSGLVIFVFFNTHISNQLAFNTETKNPIIELAEPETRLTGVLESDDSVIQETESELQLVSGKQETPQSMNDAQVEKPSLADLLNKDTLKTDVVTAFTTLLEYWGFDYNTLPGTKACTRAESAGLECIWKKGSLNTVRLYERPAVLILIDKNGLRHNVALVELSDEMVTLDFGSEKHSILRSQLESLWYGSYVLLWRPPSPSELSLKPGTRGPEVLWLRKQLDRVAQITRVRKLDPEYDAKLKERVRAFQRTHGLPADGVVGQLTLLKLNSLTAIPPVPRLSQTIQ